jgi:hypothetical protein
MLYEAQVAVSSQIKTKDINTVWTERTVVEKVATRGLYSTAGLYIADCALAPNDVVRSFISRGATTPSGAGASY